MVPENERGPLTSLQLTTRSISSLSAVLRITVDVLDQDGLWRKPETDGQPSTAAEVMSGTASNAEALQHLYIKTGLKIPQQFRKRLNMLQVSNYKSKITLKHSDRRSNILIIY